MAGKRTAKGGRSQSFAQTFRRILEGRADAAELASLDESTFDFAEGTPRDEIIAMTIVRKAMRGDVTAAKFIREIADAQTQQEQESDGAQKYEITFKVLEEEE